uniref:Uncharacterized protein n=1 Tax=Oryza meridionalis TaxID=40149 RepID=A0A0E0FET7_9ORYZ
MGLLSIIRKIKRKEKKRLAGASLFVLANKQDNQGALKPAEIAKVLKLETMHTHRLKKKNL